jgi:hypothetical protein
MERFAMGKFGSFALKRGGGIAMLPLDPPMPLCGTANEKYFLSPRINILKSILQKYI